MPTRIDFGITDILSHLLGNFDREITRLKAEHTEGRDTTHTPEGNQSGSFNEATLQVTPKYIGVGGTYHTWKK